MTRHIDKNNGCWSCHWLEEVWAESEKLLCVGVCMCEDSDHYGHILSEDHPACEQYKRTE